MKFAIIAAGKGSRLCQEGVTAPKPLVVVAGEPMMDRLLRIFREVGADEIAVVCNSEYTEVSEHLYDVMEHGLGERVVPLKYIVADTPSSMHSAWEVLQILNLRDDEPFVMTTVDTMFREEEFADYVRTFAHVVAEGKADGLMGVTSYVDDERPLYASTLESQCLGQSLPEIMAFKDDDPQGECRYISAGIYGLTGRSLKTLRQRILSGECRMRNFQRALIADGMSLRAYPFSKVFDVDHASDIVKAEEFLG